MFFSYLNFAETELVKISENQLAVLKDVLWVNVLDRVVDGVNVRIAVFECSLENERGRESATSGGPVVRTSITASALNISDIGVLCDD